MHFGRCFDGVHHNRLLLWLCFSKGGFYHLLVPEINRLNCLNCILGHLNFLREVFPPELNICRLLEVFVLLISAYFWLYFRDIRNLCFFHRAWPCLLTSHFLHSLQGLFIGETEPHSALLGVLRLQSLLGLRSGFDLFLFIIMSSCVLFGISDYFETLTDLVFVALHSLCFFFRHCDTIELWFGLVLERVPLAVLRWFPTELLLLPFKFFIIAIY